MSTRAQPALTKYLSQRLSALLRPVGPHSSRELAEKIGLSNAMVSDIARGKRGVGIQAAEKLATFFGLSMDELWGQANAHVARQPEKGPDQVSPEDDPAERYPNRVTAAKLAKDLGVDERAIESVGRDALHLDHDPEVKWWLQLMQHREALFARSAEQIAADERRSKALVDDLRQAETVEDRLKKELAKKRRRERR